MPIHYVLSMALVAELTGCERERDWLLKLKIFTVRLLTSVLDDGMKNVYKSSCLVLNCIKRLGLIPGFKKSSYCSILKGTGHICWQ